VSSQAESLWSIFSGNVGARDGSSAIPVQSFGISGSGLELVSAITDTDLKMQPAKPTSDWLSQAVATTQQQQAERSLSSRYRSHETVVRIEASTAEVWRALTTEAGLARWLAPANTVEPDLGGFIVSHWDREEWRRCIERWDVQRHLRLVARRSQYGSERANSCRMVQDFYLTPEAGGTVLRLNQSGFGQSEAWNIDFEASRQLWRQLCQRLAIAFGVHRKREAFNSCLTQLSIGNDVTHALKIVERLVDEPLQMRSQASLSWHATLPNRHHSVIGAMARPVSGGCQVQLFLLLFDQLDAAEVSSMWRERLWQSLW
jgi:uncharacterized protein YndB with AHSA1/START domain